MILPVVAYGSPVLRKTAVPVEKIDAEINTLIGNMWETMYNSAGVGLAAPQVNRSIRLFTVDTEQIFKNIEPDEEGIYPDAPGFKGVFINARMIQESGTKWAYNEGCLSIPRIREDIDRHPEIIIEYQDETGTLHTQTFNGITARVIQHEYDHLEGKLFIDHISAFKRTLIKRKLDDISKGKVRVDYRMVFHK
jgi:peptide deformylase